jgi:hypothetical protein
MGVVDEAAFIRSSDGRVFGVRIDQLINETRPLAKLFDLNSLGWYNRPYEKSS